jgi:hypothetical protein
MMMCLLKIKYVEMYLRWFAHGEPYVPYNTILERIVSSTSSSSNIHEVVNYNNNRYKSMMIDAMRINCGYSSKGL